MVVGTFLVAQGLRLCTSTARGVGGFPGSLVGKESTYKGGDPSSVPGLGRAAREGKGYKLQYSGLENSMDCIVHGIAAGQTRLSDFHFNFGDLRSCMLTATTMPSHCPQCQQ